MTVTYTTISLLVALIRKCDTSLINPLTGAIVVAELLFISQLHIYTESQYADDFDEENDTNEYGLRTGELVPVLTKAIQELSTQISDLTARVESLEG